MTCRSFFLAIMIAIPAIVLMGCGSNAQTYTYSWWKVSFDVPLDFSGPVEVGVGAATFVYPTDSEPGHAGLELTLVSVPKDLQESLDNDEGEILAFIKGTFLGTTAPADESLERIFLGKKVVGGLQDITIPKKGQLEVYLLPLADGDMLAVALMHAHDTPAESANDVIEMLAETMKELPR